MHNLNENTRYTLRSLVVMVIAIIILTFLFYPLFSQSNQPIFMVYDKGTADSQILKTDGSNVFAISQFYPKHDLEGLTCVDDTLFLTSGLDGHALSSFYSYSNYKLEKLFDTPFMELSSLTYNPTSGKFYSFADEGTYQGIIEIDKETKASKLIFPDFKHSISALQYDATNNIFYLAGYSSLYTWKFGETQLNKIYSFKYGTEIEGMLLNYPTLILTGDNVTHALELNLEKQTLTYSLLAIPSDIEDLSYCVKGFEVTVPESTPAIVPFETIEATPINVEPTPTFQAVIVPTPEIMATVEVTQVETIIGVPIETVEAPTSLHSELTVYVGNKLEKNKGIKDVEIIIEYHNGDLSSANSYVTNFQGLVNVTLEENSNYTIIVRGGRTFNLETGTDPFDFRLEDYLDQLWVPMVKR